MNQSVVEGGCLDAVTVEVRGVEAAEVDEMWSFVQSKARQRWLRQAIDHLTGVVLAYAFGKRADKVFVKLQKMLKPFGLVHFIPMRQASMDATCRPRLRASANSTPSRSRASL